MTARILNVSPDEYHALPGFSSTIAKTLLAKSPAHARAMVGKKATKSMNRGTIIHRLVLGKGKDYEVINFGDYKSNAAKKARDDAEAAGRVPVLACDFEDYCVAAEAIRIKLADMDIILDGESELAVQWEEMSGGFGAVTCRGMFDHVWLDRGIVLDLKVTEDASPLAIEKTAENFGYALQCAAYTSGLTRLKPEFAGKVKFLFAFCEPNEPHAVNVCQPDGMFRELGTRRWRNAVNLWGRCAAEDRWPAYGGGINYINPPTWALAREGIET